MHCKNVLACLVCLIIIFITGCKERTAYPPADHSRLAAEYFQSDSQWYLDNIPFFECSDKQMEQVYYYRWKMYKAHIRSTGQDQFVITEFINHVGWDRDPYCTINAASMHHIYEGRWLKDNRYMDGYINYLFRDGGNNRRYSESIADAAYARYLVNADSNFIIRQLDSMQGMYNQWSDHWDSKKNLYYIPAMPDATEYTIASIDGSGGKDGFDGGEAFRPTINSYMYGNAMAISRVAAMKGDATASNKYLQKAIALRANVMASLWNDSLQHFIDRFKMDNEYVHYWNFIRGRELAGMIPWYFDLPEDKPEYNAAWKHVTDTNYLVGKFGFRTNEPSYEYYFKQFVYFMGQRGSQWNGPSWPYQSSLTLTAMANLLNDYRQNIVSTHDYIKLLRLYAGQHYLPDGIINLVENYDPNNGGPIVYYYWSNHYNHSSFNNLIITGLCGIRPSIGDTLDINPLVDSTINYFRLDDVSYHGHNVTVLYDKDGSRYHIGKGVSVFVNGQKVSLLKKGDGFQVVIPAPVIHKSTGQPVNLALNISRQGYPIPAASVNAIPDSLIYQAIDGRTWYFPEISNRWSTQGSIANSDWFALDFGQARDISMLTISPYSDGTKFGNIDSLEIEYKNAGGWMPVKYKHTVSKGLVSNTSNTINFDKVAATAVRVVFKHGGKAIAVSEIECY